MTTLCRQFHHPGLGRHGHGHGLRRQDQQRYAGRHPRRKAAANIPELAKEKGMKSASSPRFHSTTPHRPPSTPISSSRDYYHEISCDLAMSGFDFFGGGGLKDPAGKKAQQQPPRNNAMELAKQQGYKNQFPPRPSSRTDPRRRQGHRHQRVASGQRRHALSDGSF
jgi:hypothetical protein